MMHLELRGETQKWSNKLRCLTLGHFDDTKVPGAHYQNVLQSTYAEPSDDVMKFVMVLMFNGWRYEFTRTE